MAAETGYVKLKTEPRKPLLIAAIDIGTTFSGWAYQFNHDYKISPIKVFAKNWNTGSNISTKTPTVLLLRPDGCTLEAFGYKAEDKYADLSISGEQDKWFYFRHFKMVLFEMKTPILDFKIKAQNGKSLPALRIFSLMIGKLKENLMAECQNKLVGGVEETDIMWVLTVPAIWSDGAKRFMREAAVQASIASERLIIALEPEAASMFLQQSALERCDGRDQVTMETFTPGTKYVVVDAGGGTIDMNVHEILDDNNLRELHRPVGSRWGGTMVDKAFQEFLCEIVGWQTMETLKQEYMDDYLSLNREFEVKKREVSNENESSSIVLLPLSFMELCKTCKGMDVKEALLQSRFANTVSLVRGNKLRIEASVMKSFFGESIESVMAQLESILREEQVRGCKAILMAGGYSEAAILQEETKRRFPCLHVVTSNEASVAVLKGAVIYGWNPQVIAFRVSKYTYGIEKGDIFNPNVHTKSRMFVDTDGQQKVKGIFQKYVEAGEEVCSRKPCVGVGMSFVPAAKKHIGFNLNLYATPHKHPQFVDEEDCFRVGKCFVDCRDRYGNITEVTPMLIFGGTEIQVRVVFPEDEREITNTFSLPD